MLKKTPNRRGFTLIELTIGLAVLGLLLGGLFQLSAAGNRQVVDQMTAQQIQNYLKTAKSYLMAKRANPNGTQLYLANAACAVGAETVLSPVVNTATDITESVQCFRPNTLPPNSPSNGTYKVVLLRMADVGGYGQYLVVVSITGGAVFSKVSLGQVATYIGAEGAGTYPSGESADNAGTVCNESTRNTIRGGFGNNCVDMHPASPFGTLLETNKPATLAYVSMLDTGINDTRYLWRTSAPTGMNEMATNLGIQNGQGIYFGAAAPVANAIRGVVGGISLTAGATLSGQAITGVAGGIAITGAPTANAITGVTGGITTVGGNISTGGGAIATAGGGITTTNGDVNLANGDLGARNGVFSGELRAASFIYTGSDRNIKKDIVPLTGQLNILLKIKGVSYVLKSNNEKTLGVIAQDVEAVYPELVSEKGGIKMVNYNGLMGPIIESLRELKAENDQLKKRIEILEQNR